MDKPPPPAPPRNSSVEHILPGGIGTYSISHISYFNQRLPKPEGSIFTAAQASTSDRNEENSNCSSYTGSGFTLWEETAVKKGKAGKENAVERSIGIGKFINTLFPVCYHFESFMHGKHTRRTFNHRTIFLRLGRGCHGKWMECNICMSMHNTALGT